MTIKDWLVETSDELKRSGIKSAILDAELLLGRVLNVERTWLHTHDTVELNPQTISELAKLIKRRASREPIAYITGHKEFYGRDFIVTPEVLIPRPETEDLIELAIQALNRTPRTEKKTIIDVGTGSGCIGITLKLEQPELDVTLSDVSPTALRIARKNAEHLQADVKFIESDLLVGVPPGSYNLIVANLPYVDASWATSPETAHEPQLALYATSGGLALINKLIEQSIGALHETGQLLLEADPEQHPAIIQYAAKHGFKLSQQQNYALLLSRS